MVVFQRRENGDVQVTIISGERCLGCGEYMRPENAWMEDGCPCNTPKGVNASILRSECVEAGIWVSEVLNTTSFSERPGDWHAWMAHHQGSKDILEGQRGGY